jgi:hypothetical protein
LRDVLAEALGIVNHLLTRSVRIEVSTEILHLDLEGMLEVTTSALESHVLGESERGVFGGKAVRSLGTRRTGNQWRWDKRSAVHRARI